jgi:hypothetical protein
MIVLYSRIKMVDVIREDKISKQVGLFKKPASTVAGFLMPTTFADR